MDPLSIKLGSTLVIQELSYYAPLCTLCPLSSFHANYFVSRDVCLNQSVAVPYLFGFMS